MLICLKAKCKSSLTIDYQLIDILRSLSIQNRCCVISRKWFVTALDLYTYRSGASGSDALALLLPETVLSSDGSGAYVSGERLLERSSIVHQFEDGLFMRVIDESVSITVLRDYKLRHGPANFQSSNVDLEIRCGEAAAYEVVSDDEALIMHLADQFAVTKIIG